MFSEVRLELRIQSDIAGVVEQQIELRLLRTRPRQIVIIEGAAIRRHGRRIVTPWVY